MRLHIKVKKAYGKGFSNSTYYLVENQNGAMIAKRAFNFKVDIFDLVMNYVA